jgi:hypothetical protein
MGSRFIDHCESRRALRRRQDKRFLYSSEFNVNHVWRVCRQKIDRASPAMVVIVRFYFRTGLSFQMRQVGKMRMNESPALMIVTRVQMEHRPVHDCQQQ